MVSINTTSDKETSFLDFLGYMEDILGTDGEDYSWRVYKANHDPFVVFIGTKNNAIIDQSKVWFGQNIQLLDVVPVHLEKLKIISQG